MDQLIADPLVGEGLSTIYKNDNIAIVVLMVCLVFSGVFNIILLNGLLKMKDVFATLAMAINELNIRLDKHD